MIKSFVRRVAAVAGLSILLVGVALVAESQAQESKDPAYLSLGIGYYDFIADDDTAVDFRLEYRSDLALWLIRPFAGLEVTTDGAVYGLGGIFLDVHVLDNIVLTPSIGVGAYGEGDGKDLGSVFEIRSQAEIAYQFEDASRLSLAISHISNAGVGDHNPGTEIISVYYHLPIDKIF